MPRLCSSRGCCCCYWRCCCGFVLVSLLHCAVLWRGAGPMQLYDRFGLVEEQVAVAHKVLLASSMHALPLYLLPPPCTRSLCTCYLLHAADCASCLAPVTCCAVLFLLLRLLSVFNLLGGRAVFWRGFRSTTVTQQWRRPFCAFGTCSCECAPLVMTPGATFKGYVSIGCCLLCGHCPGYRPRPMCLEETYSPSISSSRSCRPGCRAFMGTS